MLAELATINCPNNRPASSGGKLQWTGSLVEWVELIYALHAAGVINDGKISLKHLFRVLGEVFDFEAGEYSRTFTDIKNRVKGERTSFLDTLKQLLRRRMEAADMKLPKK
jgi:hypothetical protein